MERVNTDNPHPTSRRPTRSSQARSLGAGLAAAALLAACTYGPPEDRYEIAHALRRPETHTLAAVVRRTRERQPRGLARFPDGGAVRVLEADFTLYLLDAERRSIRQVVRRPAPARLLRTFSAWIVGWDEDGVYLRLSGCPGDECWGDLRQRQLLRVTPDGALAEIEGIPDAARPAGESLAPMQGESTYMRIGYDAGEIRVTTTPGEPPRTVFVLDRSNGTLRAAEAAPQP